MSIVGTAPMNHAPSVSMSSSARPGSKACMRTSVARRDSEPSAPRTHPPVWNIGMGLNQAAPSGTPMRSLQMAALSTMPACRSWAPFGKPVVPLVYWICAGSSGPTSGSSMSAAGPPGSASASRSGSWSRRSTSRSSVSSGRTASTWASNGFARTSGTVRIPAARDWRST